MTAIFLVHDEITARATVCLHSGTNICLVQWL